MHYFIFGLIGLFLVWTVGSYLVIRNLEEPKYTVLETRNDYEIREYAPYLIAEANVTGDYEEATRQGFRIIADYIFGNNVSQSSIAMTAPVLENKASEPIAMTIPVLETETNPEERVISFVLPSEYTLATLPRPNNPEVNIREVGARKVAALKYTWYPTAARAEAKKTELKNLLAQDGFVIAGAIQVARYNPPLSMPLMLRNEILIPIE